MRAWLKLAGLLLGLVGALLLFNLLTPVLAPVLVGLTIAYLLDPPVEWLARRRVRRELSAILVMVLLVGLVAGVAAAVYPLLQRQVGRVIEDAPDLAAKLKQQLQSWPLINNIVIHHRSELDSALAYVAERVRENLPKLWAPVGQFLGDAVSSLIGFLLGILSLIVVPVFAYYLLVDFPKLRRGMLDLIPERHHQLARQRYHQLDAALGGFIRGQLLVALVLVAVYALGLGLLKVPYYFLIALVGGLANLVPYMGLVVGLLPAVLASLLTGGWIQALGAAGVFGLGQLLEGTVLGPRLVGDRVGLHPVWVLIAVIAGGRYLGFVGLLLAVPIAAAIRVFLPDLLAVYRRSEFFRGAQSP
ncbi:MAG TPA: AI-2E family transporter [Acidobacteriota bacterium]